MKRTFLVPAFTLIAVLGLAACGSSSSSATTSGSGSATTAAAAGGTFAVITVDPSNPYWKAEVDTAVAEAKKLGYSTTVDAHNNDNPSSP